MDEEKKGIGTRFQDETKYLRDGMKVYSSDVFERAEQYKHYPDATKVLPLPPVRPEGQAGFWDTIINRRSQRDFTKEPLALDELALLIFATQGITEKWGDTMFRAAPSAGALYPIETYIHANRVTGLDCGIYHLNTARQALEFIRPGDCSPSLAIAALGQDMVRDSAAVFLWTAIPGRSTWKYHERAYRYIYLDAGHIGQNLCLAATALGLGCCTIGAFFDTEVNEIIGIDGQNETAVYLGVIGTVQE
ncbi:MAG: SagB/ThcOx family dehydrogenase [Deltaproteobacteria bacterium]|nr:SagB/ThcOx family dehydrogenase [Deltaproteobacteria bacterium]